MKIIGISIDGVIRDKITQFDKIYRKNFIKNESIVKMDEYFRYVPEDLDESENIRIENKVNELITYPIDTYDLRNHYKFDSLEQYKDFIDKDFVFEIYGSASPIHKSMDKINKIQKIGEQNSSYEIVLLSDEEEMAIQATYHFLAKAACRIKKLIFEKNLNRVWDYCDMIITENPSIIECKPENKLVTKIIHEYNKYDKSDYEFNTMNEIDEFFILKLINENKL